MGGGKQNQTNEDDVLHKTEDGGYKLTIDFDTRKRA